MRKVALAAALLLAVTSPAFAIEGTLDSDGGSVFVFKSKDAHVEALQLIRAGVHQSNPALLMPLISCFAESGSKAITTSVGIMTHDILVVSGPSAGCRGNIAMERFKAAR